MASSDNANWTVFNGRRRGGNDRREGGRQDGNDRREGGGDDRRREGGRREFPSAFGGGRRQDGGGGRREFPGAFQRRGPSDGRRDPVPYSREWHEAQRRAQEEERHRAEATEQKSREFNDVNFPDLVSAFETAPAQTRHVPATGWTQRGSDLARAWGEAEEEQRMVEAIRARTAETRQRNAALFAHSVMPIPRARWESTPDDETEAEEPAFVGAGAGGEDEWTTVDSAKKRRPVTRSGLWHHLDEVPEGDTVWGEEDASTAQDDTVW